MNQTEVRAWIKKLSVVFPDTGNWLLKQSRETFDAWSEFYFSKVPAAEADEFLNEMIYGRIQKPEAYNREDIPVMLFAHWRKKQHARRALTEDEEYSRRGPKARLEDGERPLGEAFRELVRNRFRSEGN